MGPLLDRGAAGAEGSEVWSSSLVSDVEQSSKVPTLCQARVESRESSSFECNLNLARDLYLGGAPHIASFTKVWQPLNAWTTASDFVFQSRHAYSKYLHVSIHVAQVLQLCTALYSFVEVVEVQLTQ